MQNPDELLDKLRKEILRKEITINYIYTSRNWRVANKLNRLRYKLAPPLSKRENFLRSIYLVYKKYLNNIRKVTKKISGSNFANQSIFRIMENYPDEKYMSIIIRSVNEPIIDCVKMPGFPATIIQKNWVGSSNEEALWEGFHFYKVVKWYSSAFGRKITPGTKVVDFGCGWGRISRFFFKDILDSNFIGLDINGDMISFCQKEMHHGNYYLINPLPPTPLEDDSVDIIFAYSVFSHLAENVSMEWIKEFKRILKPGGILLATTQGRSFLDFCESLHGKKHTFAWFKGLANSFLPIDQAKVYYDRGKYLFSQTNPSDRYYGETLIPKEYIVKEYSKYLLFKEFFDDRNALPQALFVMQKE